MKKYLLRIAKGVAYLGLCCVLLVLALFAVNLADEELRPEVRAALNWELPPGAVENNGYVALLGIDAPAGSDPYQTGLQMLRSEITRYKVRNNNFQKVLDDNKDNIFAALDWQTQSCNYSEQNCVVYYRENRAKFSKLISDSRLLEQRFDAIAAMNGFTEVFPPHAGADILKWEHLVHALELKRIKAVYAFDASQTTQGMELLAANVRFAKRFMQGTTSLFGRRDAIVNVRKDMRIISWLVQNYPLGRNELDTLLDLVQSASPVGLDMEKPFLQERASRVNTLHSPDAENSPNTLAERTFNPLYLPNATLNLLYDFYGPIITLAKTDAHELDAGKQTAEKKQKVMLGFGVGPFFPRNPVGKFLVSLTSTEHFNVYLEGWHDTLGCMRLVALQLKLLRDRTLPAEMPSAVRDVPAEFFNPYTRQPMVWDEKTHTIQFQGRRASYTNWQRSRVFSIKMY